MSGEPIGPPMKHEGQINGALILNDGQRMLSWSADGTLRLWDISWQGNNLFEIACNHWPEHDLALVSKQYGVTIADPICESKTIPLPNWSSVSPGAH